MTAALHVVLGGTGGVGAAVARAAARRGPAVRGWLLSCKRLAVHEERRTAAVP